MEISSHESQTATIPIGIQSGDLQNIMSHPVVYLKLQSETASYCAIVVKEEIRRKFVLPVFSDFSVLAMLSSKFNGPVA